MSVDRNIMSNVMVVTGVKSFKDIEQNPMYGFKNRLFKPDNINIKVLVSSLFYNTNNLTNYWNAMRY